MPLRYHKPIRAHRRARAPLLVRHSELLLLPARGEKAGMRGSCIRQRQLRLRPRMSRRQNLHLTLTLVCEGPGEGNTRTKANSPRLLLPARGEKAGMRGSRLRNAGGARQPLVATLEPAPHPNPLPVKDGERETRLPACEAAMRSARGLTLASPHVTPLGSRRPRPGAQFRCRTPPLAIPLP